MSAPARLLDNVDRQVGWCRQGGSPFSAQVLAVSRRWLDDHPEALQALAAVSDDPLAGAVALRWLAGLHRLALQGLEPWRSLWPPASSAATDEALREAIDEAWRSQRAAMEAALAGPPQTNEVQRSAVLLPGLLHVAARTGLPVALAEIGASAGLNLWCDHYRHDHGAWAWGDAQSPLVLGAEWVGPAPAEAKAPLRIAQRAGCDVSPVDLTEPDEALRLQSYVWADQPERLARLRAAMAIARPLMAAQGVAIQAARAAGFVRAQLAARRPGQAWVLMHSVVWQYIPVDEQAAIQALLDEAGAAATPQSPLAWLRMEPPRPDVRMALRCRLWPGGEDRLLAQCHPHGQRIEWLAASAA